MKQSVYVFMLVCLSLIFAIASTGYSGILKTNPRTPPTGKSMDQRSTVRMVEGIIENVTNDSIEVRGEIFNISGILLINSSGKVLKQTSLIPGKKVEIFFKEGIITSILIYDDIVE